MISQKYISQNFVLFLNSSRNLFLFLIGSQNLFCHVILNSPLVLEIHSIWSRFVQVLFFDRKSQAKFVLQAAPAHLNTGMNLSPISRSPAHWNEASANGNPTKSRKVDCLVAAIKENKQEDKREQQIPIKSLACGRGTLLESRRFQVWIKFLIHLIGKVNMYLMCSRRTWFKALSSLTI